MDKDYSVGAVSNLPTFGTISKKPSYLITLEDSSGKKNSFQRFISIDKPDSQSGFILVKGIFTDSSEEDIVKKFSDLLTSTPKESILEIWFPWHRVISVRSLVFNANKIQNLLK